MKAGDRVILKEFDESELPSYLSSDSHLIGKQVDVEYVDDSDGTFSFNDNDWWLQSACDLVTPNPTMKNERYFFFSYVSGNSTGNIRMKNIEGKIPSNVFITEYLKKEYSLNKAVITNIFEFKSEQDFLDFTNE